MAKAKKKTTTKTEQPAEETPEASEEEVDTSPRNPRRDGMAETLLAKRREELAQETGTEAAAEAEEEAPEEFEQEAEEEQAAGEAEEAGEEAAEDVPEYASTEIVHQEGKEYLKASDGSLIPVEAAVRGYRKEQDSDRILREAATTREQAKQYYEQAQALNKRREAQPKLTKEQAQERAQELNEIRQKHRDALLESDYDEADRLDAEYNGKLVELISSGQSGPEVDENYISDIVNRQLTAKQQEDQENALGEAYTWYEKNHPEIAQDPRWNGMFGGVLEDLHAKNPEADPRELFKEGVQEVKKVMTGGGKSKREDRKSSAATGARPGSAAGRAEAVDNRDPALTGGNKISEADLNKMRRKAFEDAEKRGKQVTGNVGVSRGAQR